MYTLVRHFQIRDGVAIEFPSFAVSLALAELFYQFHSFTLECLCFLATWAALSLVLGPVVSRLLPRASASAERA